MAVVDLTRQSRGETITLSYE